MASSFATQQHQTQQQNQQQQQQHQQPPHHQHHHHHNQHHHQACNQPAGLDIKLIASSFVKQYYTLLNKAPCFIHNFYNHDSTFIHGTIEMGNEHHTEPVIGREQIESKMKELKLNDCRAKIKQIDCLETLANGLLIQVIGELSNNGRPMRRFLQTFVLASSPDPDGDSKVHVRTNTNATTNTNNTAHDNRRSVQISENSTSSSHNQKFYVLNSIFRYQDDGPDSEFEDDSVSGQANTSIESAKSGPNEINDDIHNSRAKPTLKAQPPTQQPTQQSVASTPISTTIPTAAAAKQSTVPEPSVAEPSKRTEPVQIASGSHNGATNVQAYRQSEKKIETPDKAPSENGDSPSNDNLSQIVRPPSDDTGVPSSTAANQIAASSNAAQQSSAPAPRPSNEPKTWADMVRNALPQSAATVQNASVSSSKDSQQASPNQSLQTQNNQPNSQNQTQNEVQNAQNSTNSGNNNNSNNNKNRRRHMIRKPANKAGAGRPMKKNTAMAQSIGRRT